jgi:hypothetical protein
MGPTRRCCRSCIATRSRLGTPFTEAIEISTGEAVSASDRVWMALPFEVTGLTVNTGDPAPPAGVRVVSLDSWVSRRGL